ncbi:hypothetical protein [Streptomyces nigrescens]
MSGTKNGGHSGADDPFEEGGTSLLPPHWGSAWPAVRCWARSWVT